MPWRFSLSPWHIAVWLPLLPNTQWTIQRCNQELSQVSCQVITMHLLTVGWSEIFLLKFHKYFLYDFLGRQVSSTVPGQAEPSAVPRRLSSLKENVGIFTGSLKLAAHEINTIWSDSLFMLLDSITATASYPTNLNFLYDWKIFSQCWSRIWYCLEKFFVQIIYHSPSILNKYSSFSITDDAQITVNLKFWNKLTNISKIELKKFLHQWLKF